MWQFLLSQSLNNFNSLTSESHLFNLNRVGFSKWLLSMFVILVVAGGIGALKYNVFDKNPAPQEAPKQMAIASDESTETMETASIVSPNGKKTLILEKQKNADDTTYTFYVEDSETGAKASILSKNLGPDQTMSAPDNAFSPDNRYFFVKENDAGALSYIVF